jgi:hypothetical protein
MINLKGDAAILNAKDSILPLTVREPAPAATAKPAATTTPGAAQPVMGVLWIAGGFAALTFLFLLIMWISELIRRRQVKKVYETQ